MTDLEISKALALAIGWRPEQMRVVGVCDHALILQESEWHTARVFDYTSWNVIGPIAMKFDCYPEKCCGEWSAMLANDRLTWVEADTPQKAIAMAVIEAHK
jgi:hypothetical protein